MPIYNTRGHIYFVYSLKSRQGLYVISDVVHVIRSTPIRFIYIYIYTLFTVVWSIVWWTQIRSIRLASSFKAFSREIPIVCKATNGESLAVRWAGTHTRQSLTSRESEINAQTFALKKKKKKVAGPPREMDSLFLYFGKMWNSVNFFIVSFDFMSRLTVLVLLAWLVFFFFID